MTGASAASPPRYRTHGYSFRISALHQGTKKRGNLTGLLILKVEKLNRRKELFLHAK